MWLCTFATDGNGITQRVSLEQAADVYLGTEQRGRLGIADGAHKMPIVGERVINASNSVIRRTRGACGRAKTDCVQAVTDGGVVAHWQVTPKRADDRTKSQTTRVTSGSVPGAAEGRGGERIIPHCSRGILEAQ